MPSYLAQDNIAAAQPTPIQPAVANIDAIARTFQTKVGYWAQGASRVKSAYQNYLNLDLTREDNQKNLYDFMQGANEQLKKVSQSDLSLGDNQMAAMSVFQPLTDPNNQMAANIQGDNAITKHYKQQFGMAEAARYKDGGKDFSETNLRSLQMSLNDYRNDSDPNNWRTHYGSKEYYSPYYDVNKEILDLRKSFQPSVIEESHPYAEPIKDSKGNVTGYKDTDYIRTVKDSSTTAAQWKVYLQSNLSDKAKNQLGINAKVAYGGNLDAIGSDYKDYVLNRSKLIDQQISRLDGAIASPATSLEQKKTLQTQRQEVIDGKNSLMAEVNKINSGDVNFIKSNRDRLTSYMYTDKYLNNVSEGLARTNTIVEDKPDKVKLDLMHESMENARFNTKLTQDWQIAQLHSNTQLAIAAMKDKKEKEGTTLATLPTEQLERQGDLETNGAQKFADDLVGVRSQLADNEVELAKKLTNNDPNFKNLNKDAQDAYVMTWKTQQQALRSKGLKTDPIYDQYDYNHSRLQIDLNTKNQTKQYIDNQLKGDVDNYFNTYKDRIDKVDSKYDKAALSSKDIVNALLNNTLHITEQWVQKDPNAKPIKSAFPLGLKENPDVKKMLNIKIGDKTITVAAGGQTDDKIATLRNMLDNKESDPLKNKIKDLYNQNYLNLNTLQRAVDPNAPLVKATRENIANRTGVKASDIGEIRWDGVGNVYVNFLKDAKGNQIDPKKMAEAYGSYAEAPKDKEGYMKITDIKAFTTSFKDPILKSINDNLNVQVSNEGVGTSPKGLWEPINNGEFFRIRNSGSVESPQYMLIYEDKKTGQDVPIYGATADNMEEIAAKAKAIAVNPYKFLGINTNK